MVEKDQEKGYNGVIVYEGEVEKENKKQPELEGDIDPRLPPRGFNTYLKRKI